MASNSKLSKTLERMFSLHPMIIDFDLKRLKTLMNKFNNPHNRLRNVVHIAGTNGKGSTASFLKEILEAHNLSVNVYTSPHLINFNERIRIKNKLIPNKTLIEILEEIETKNNYKPITFFEITTAAAILAFSRNESDINIFEAGLGGRLDATNVIDKKKLCIITKIGFDHQEFLGENIENIASEKAGIFRENTPIVLAKQNNKKALKVLINSASKFKSKLIKLEQVSKKATLGLKGSHQYENASTAFTAAKQIIKSISESKTLFALQNTLWHGRMYHITSGKIVKFRNNVTILDGAHNEDGALVVNEFLKEYSLGKWNLIIGMTNNRDVKKFVKIFKDHINKSYSISVPDSKSSYTPKYISSKLRELGIQSLPVNDLETALKLADKGLPLLITGSLYLAGHTLNFNNTIIR